jgi:ribosomal protein S18 acetylase RimI-like enzyme
MTLPNFRSGEAVVDVRVLRAGDEALLEHVHEDVFDHAVDPRLAREFLEDPRHHLVVAIDAGRIVAFASGVHYVHPDKPAELFINEVGVAPSHQRRGLGQAVVSRLLEEGRVFGCRQAWVLTDADNVAAQRLYVSTGGKASATPSIMFEFPL